MLTHVVQRWRSRRDSYRPAGELFDPRAHEVAPIDGDGADSTASAFVTAHHYSGTYPAARERVGLYRGTEMVGVAVFSHPPQDKVLSVLPCPKAEAVELGRFVLLDGVAANAESWFIARAFEVLRARGYAGVVSFADPVPRRSSAGDLVFPGHVGTIYQATNAVYTGKASPRTLRLLPSGQVFSERARSKIRRRERGWRYAVDDLIAAGAAPPERTASAEDLATWLARELPLITRPMRHRGNHRYLFALSRAVRRRLPDGQPYPKITVAGRPVAGESASPGPGCRP